MNTTTPTIVVTSNTATDASPAARSSFAGGVGLIFRRSFAQARRAPVLAFGFPVAFPLLMIGLFSQIYGRITRLPDFPAGSYLTFMAPAVFLMAAMFGSGYSASSLVTDVQTGYLDRLRLIPIRPSAIMLGRLLFDVVRVTIAGSVVLGASVAFGASFDAGPVDVIAMITVLAVWTLGYTGLFYFVGLKTRSHQKLAVLIPLFLPISLLSTAYAPRNLVPGWVQTAATINPYSHVVDAVRDLMAGHATVGVVAGALAAGAAFIALTQLGAARAFARLVRAD